EPTEAWTCPFVVSRQTAKALPLGSTATCDSCAFWLAEERTWVEPRVPSAERTTASSAREQQGYGPSSCSQTMTALPCGSTAISAPTGTDVPVPARVCVELRVPVAERARTCTLFSIPLKRCHKKPALPFRSTSTGA